MHIRCCPWMVQKCGMRKGPWWAVWRSMAGTRSLWSGYVLCLWLLRRMCCARPALCAWKILLTPEVNLLTLSLGHNLNQRRNHSTTRLGRQGKRTHFKGSSALKKKCFYLFMTALFHYRSGWFLINILVICCLIQHWNFIQIGHIFF